MTIIAQKIEKVSFYKFESTAFYIRGVRPKLGEETIIPYRARAPQTPVKVASQMNLLTPKEGQRGRPVAKRENAVAGRQTREPDTRVQRSR